MKLNLRKKLQEKKGKPVEVLQVVKAGGNWQNTLKEQQWIYEDDKPTDKENYYL